MTIHEDLIEGRIHFKSDKKIGSGFWRTGYSDGIYGLTNKSYMYISDHYTDYLAGFKLGKQMRDLQVRYVK